MRLIPWELPTGAAALSAAAGVFARAAVAPSSQIFGPVLRDLPEGRAKNRIALTFDDGPNPGVTPRLLDLLTAHNVSATFFVIGRYARENPAIIREIAARGHLLGNHTDSHPNLIWLSAAQIATELRSCRDAVMTALASSQSPTGAHAHDHMQWLRPPFGYRGPQLRNAARRFAPAGIATWSRLAFDWKPQPAARLIARLARVRAGDILLLHDGDHRQQNGDRSHLIGALEHWLPRWRDAGFEFVTIPTGAAPTA